MVTPNGSGSDPADIDQLGLSKGMVVQELGWDDDVDQDLRDEVMDTIDAELVEDAVEAVDVVLLWHRDDDSDVADALVDALRDLSRTGWIWLLTPKIGRPGYVDPADITEGVNSSGLVLTSGVDASHDWQAHKVVRPRNARR